MYVGISKIYLLHAILNIAEDEKTNVLALHYIFSYPVPKWN